MKALVILVAVVMAIKAAKVPQEVTQHNVVTVPVPNGVLAAAGTVGPHLATKDMAKNEMSAQVVEVAKGPITAPNTKTVVLTTQQPVTKANEMMSTMRNTLMKNKMERKTRAVPFVDSQKVQPQNQNVVGLKDMLVQKQPVMVDKMSKHRSMRSVMVKTSTEVPVTVQTIMAMLTKRPVVKSSDSSTASTIDPCDLLCTKFEFEPICATNGLCLHEFPNQCMLETYNCKHPGGKFRATKDGKCQMNGLAKCEESELI